MSVKYIAHASIDEKGNIKNGQAGDQTTREVCIRTWYSKPWNYVLRLKDQKVRNQFANNMIDLAKNSNVGYDQNQRNTLLTQAEKVDFNFSKITTKCECDCSSAITICILGAVFKVLGKEAFKKAKAGLVVNGNCATTSTLRSYLTKLDMITSFNSSVYIGSTSKAIFGDIYVKEGSHVVCYINDGKKVSSATNNSGDTKKSVTAIAKEVIDGKWGSGEDRKKKLTKAGYDYKTVQKKVNELLKK